MSTKLGELSAQGVAFRGEFSWIERKKKTTWDGSEGLLMERKKLGVVTLGLT